MSPRYHQKKAGTKTDFTACLRITSSLPSLHNIDTVSRYYPSTANCQPKYSTIIASGLALRLLELCRAAPKIVA
jgi:hypothetical protein